MYSIKTNNLTDIARRLKNGALQRKFVLFAYVTLHTGFWLVPKSMSLKGVVISYVRYLCGSWASR